MLETSAIRAMRAWTEAGLGDAVERVYEASLELMLRRIELLAAEVRVLVRGGVAYMFASIVALIGWLYLVSGAVDALALRYPRHHVEIGVGLIHCLLAIGLFAIAMRATRRVVEP